MKNEIFLLGEENRKVLGFNDDYLIISSKKHKSFESLLAAKEKSGMLESVKVIPIASIKAINYNEQEDLFKVLFTNEKGKEKSDSILLKNLTLRPDLVATISEIRGFNKTVETESATKPLLYNLLGVAFAIVCTYVGRDLAIDAQNGEHYVATGRRSGLAQLVANLVESMGPTSVTIIGILATLFMAYRAYQRYNQPASVISFK